MLARLFSTAPRCLATLSSSTSSHASTSFLAPSSSSLTSSRRPFSSSLPSFLPSSSSTTPSPSVPAKTSSSPTEPVEKDSEEEDTLPDEVQNMIPAPHDPLTFLPPQRTRPVASDFSDFIDPTTGKLYPPSLLPRTNPIPKFIPQRQYKDEIEVDKDHPLYAFFHQDPKTGQYLTMELVPEGGLDMIRPWTAAELRVKSFQDLHTLWALLLREKNIYYTQKAEIRRKEADKNRDWGTRKARQMIQVSMARIKHVLNERQIVFRAEATRSKAFAHEQRLLQKERLMIEDLETQVEEEDDLVDEEAEADEKEEDEEHKATKA